MKWDYQLELPDDLDEEDELDDPEPGDDFYNADALADAAEDQWLKWRNL